MVRSAGEARDANHVRAEALLVCVCSFKTQPLDGAKRSVRGVSGPPPVQTAVFTVSIHNALKKKINKKKKTLSTLYIGTEH